MVTISRGVPVTPIVERAYQLAGTGEFASYYKILLRLKKEGYTEVSAHLDGVTIRADLNNRCHVARGDGTRAHKPAAKLRAKAESEKRRAAKRTALRRAALKAIDGRA